MARLFAIILILTVSLGVHAQEICDNGIDDDGNGLIDLEDGQCICFGIGAEEIDVTYKIPNADFESMDCCPDFISQVTDCLQDWVAPTHGTADFLHTCDFMFQSVYDAGLHPFPSGGEGIVHIISSPNWSEYIAVCLNEPLEVGVTYVFTIEIAFAPTLMTQPYPLCVLPPKPAIPMSVFINENCNNFNMIGILCPPSLHPSWVEIGTTYYSVSPDWSTLSITFTPSVETYALAFGSGCDIPNEYYSAGQQCAPSFFLDAITLSEISSGGELTLDLSGDLCGNGVLSAFADPPGGTFQWYHNGVAILGENNETFYLTPENYQPGEYTVTYTIGDECLWDSLELTYIIPTSSEDSVFACSGESAICAGESFSESGIYEVILNSYSGCDSLVTCHIDIKPQSPPTQVSFEDCYPASYAVCEEIFFESGLYQVTCQDIYGCDSLVDAHVRIFTPFASIVNPGPIGCSGGPLALDGSGSVQNPLGLTLYQWTGPIGGIVGSSDIPTIQISMPGTYCLTVVHVGQNTSCSQEDCITITESEEPPLPPQIVGPVGTCLGDSMLMVAVGLPGNSQDTLHWNLSDSLQYFTLYDTTLVIWATQAGDYQVCAHVINSCGTSDTICRMVTFLSNDSTSLFQSTCNPLNAGIFQTTYQNIEGCDSIVTRFVDLLPTDTTRLEFYVCEPGLAVHDTIYLLNQYDCDSIIYIHRILSDEIIIITESQICGQGVPFSDTTWVSSGPCDSLLITNFLFIEPDTTLLDASTCDPNAAGIYTTILTNVSGCDSTVITNISLLPSSYTAVEDYTCDPSEAKEEILVLSNQVGCDSIVEVSIIYVGIDTLYESVYSCDSSKVGTQILSIPGPICDTITVVTTQWAPFNTTYETVYTCDPSGPAADTILFVNQGGCDSLHVRQYVYTTLAGQVILVDERCYDEHNGQISISDVTGGLFPYLYKLDNQPWQSEPLFEGLSPGVYDVSIQDSRGCIRTYDGNTVGSGQLVALDAGVDMEVPPGEMIELHGQSSVPMAEWLWVASDPLSCHTCAMTILGPIQIAQTVYLNGVSLKGCRGSDDLKVTVKSLSFPEVFIPNSFSPNYDGINDIFSIYGNRFVASVRNMAIYDRWGNSLFYRADLPINDPSAGWDGSFRDKEMDPGVYVYVVELELIDGSIKIYKGDVTLIR